MFTSLITWNAPSRNLRSNPIPQTLATGDNGPYKRYVAAALIQASHDEECGYCKKGQGPWVDYAVICTVDKKCPAHQQYSPRLEIPGGWMGTIR
jgi:hypothetical protein